MKILIVDDNEQNTYQLQILLAANGYEVVTSENGAEALAIAREKAPDLIVSDILMPVMDGFALCREWKKDTNLRNIPFIFYTATYTDERDREFALRLGARRFLVKPEEPEVFIRTIRDVINEVRDSATRPVSVQSDIPDVESESGETDYLRQYNAVLIHKMEAKMQQLEQARLELERDIVMRQKAEARLRLQSSALEAAANAIIITDRNGRIELVNGSFSTLTGYSAPECIGETPSLLKSGKQDDKFYQNLWNIICDGKVWHGELINRRKDGTFYTEEMTITPIRDSEGGITHFIAVKQDITTRKLVEAQFLRAQRMESIGTLAAGIAHDLNNALAPMLMGLDILKSQVKDDASRKLIDVLQGSAQHGADLVRQVLSFGRGVEGATVVVNLAHILTDIQEMIRDTFPKNIDFRLVPRRDVSTVTGDATHLKQVFTNLCVNARDAMPNGGTLRVTIEDAELDETYAEMNPDSKAGTYVMVTVEDNGCGMPPGVQDRIFEPFFTTKEIGKGTGLGLSTTMAIIKSHGGFIKLYSEVGKGTCFKVYLPATSSLKAVRETPAEKNGLPCGNGETILLVDDEERIRFIAQNTLERFGYRVLLAANGAEAVALYAQNRGQIDLVLTDMAMPLMDGPCTINALRAIDPDVTIIGSSGLASYGTVAKAGDIGVKHFVPKPYTAETLLTALPKTLQDQP